MNAYGFLVIRTIAHTKASTFAAMMLRILRNPTLLLAISALAFVADAREAPHAGTADIHALPKRLLSLGPNLKPAPHPRVADNKPTHQNSRSMLFFVDPFGDCPDKYSINDNAYYGDCGAFMQKNDENWCTASGSEYCCAQSDDECCETDDGAVAGLVIGLIVGLTLCITACAWCCKCCCFRPKPAAPVIVQMAAPPVQTA
jgi:hypothetical protein